jgi:hypothetical protein
MCFLLHNIAYITGDVERVIRRRHWCPLDGGGGREGLLDDEPLRDVGSGANLRLVQYPTT